MHSTKLFVAATALVAATTLQAQQSPTIRALTEGGGRRPKRWTASSSALRHYRLPPGWRRGQR